MSFKNQQPTDPDLHGVPAALLRAAEAARRLAQQTATPFIVRQPDAVPPSHHLHTTSLPGLRSPEVMACYERIWASSWLEVAHVYANKD